MHQNCCHYPRYEKCCYSTNNSNYCAENGTNFDDCCQWLRRNRSFCDCHTVRCMPNACRPLKPRLPPLVPPLPPSPPPTKSKSHKSRSPKPNKIKSTNTSEAVLSTAKRCCRTPSPNQNKRNCCNAKNMKNRQNYQCQDMLGRNRMEVINEEQDEDELSDSENCYLGNDQSKKIQDSCVDFLNIVHDTVLDTVKRSVDSMLQQHFCNTVEKIEHLCAQLMRNECLISKMYLDLIDKFSQLNDRNTRQFKCICQFLADYRKGETNEFDGCNQRQGSFDCDCGPSAATLDDSCGNGQSQCNCTHCHRQSGGQNMTANQQKKTPDNTSEWKFVDKSGNLSRTSSTSVCNVRNRKNICSTSAASSGGIGVGKRGTNSVNYTCIKIDPSLRTYVKEGASSPELTRK